MLNKISYNNQWKIKFEPCLYSNRLLDRLSLLNEKTDKKIDLDEVKKAIYYAKKYHANQKRQSGEPYYSHPLEVAYMVADYLFRTDIIITSILHDTIEDTELTKEMIAEIFGNVIANQVEDLTRIKENKKISTTEIVKLLWLQKKYDVLMIKLFDRLHNIQTINVKSPEKINKIVKETLEEFITLTFFFKVPEIKHSLIKLCFQNLITTQHLPHDQYLQYES